LIFANFSILSSPGVTSQLEKGGNYFTACRTLVNLVFISRKFARSNVTSFTRPRPGVLFTLKVFSCLARLCDTIGIRKRSSKNRRTFYNSLRDKRYSHGVHRAQLSTREEIWKTVLEKRIDPPITINAGHFCIS